MQTQSSHCGLRLPRQDERNGKGRVRRFLPILIYGRDFRRLCLSDKVVHADAKPAPMDLLHPMLPLLLIPSQRRFSRVDRTGRNVSGVRLTSFVVNESGLERDVDSSTARSRRTREIASHSSTIFCQK